MPSFAVAYVVLLLAFGVYSFYDDWKDRRSAGYLATDAAPLLLGALSWTAWDAWRELTVVIAARPESYDPELSEAWNLRIDRGLEAGVVLLGVLVMAPAIFCAIRVALRSW